MSGCSSIAMPGRAISIPSHDRLEHWRRHPENRTYPPCAQAIAATRLAHLTCNFTRKEAHQRYGSPGRAGSPRGSAGEGSAGARRREGAVRASVGVEQVAGHDDALHLVRALVDLGDLG